MRCRRTTATGKPCRQPSTTGDCGRHTSSPAAPPTVDGGGTAVAAGDPFAAPPADLWEGVHPGVRAFVEQVYAGMSREDIAQDVAYYEEQRATHQPAPLGANLQMALAAHEELEDIETSLGCARTALRLHDAGALTGLTPPPVLR